MQARPATSLNRLTRRSANRLERHSLVEMLMSADRLPLSDVRAFSQQTSCLLGRTSLSHPLPASFLGVGLFSSFDTQIHMLISPELMEMPLNLC